MHVVIEDDIVFMKTKQGWAWMNKDGNGSRFFATLEDARDNAYAY